MREKVCINQFNICSFAYVLFPSWQCNCEPVSASNIISCLPHHKNDERCHWWNCRGKRILRYRRPRRKDHDASIPINTNKTIKNEISVYQRPEEKKLIQYFLSSTFRFSSSKSPFFKNKTRYLSFSFDIDRGSLSLHIPIFRFYS